MKYAARQTEGDIQVCCLGNVVLMTFPENEIQSYEVAVVDE